MHQEVYITGQETSFRKQCLTFLNTPGTEKANNRDPQSSCCARAENLTQSSLPKLVRVPEKYGRRPLRATPKYFSGEKKSPCLHNTPKF